MADTGEGDLLGGFGDGDAAALPPGRGGDPRSRGVADDAGEVGGGQRAGGVDATHADRAVGPSAIAPLTVAMPMASMRVLFSPLGVVAGKSRLFCRISYWTAATIKDKKMI
ncbi:MAG: hypothetical protein AAF356_06850 [Planctomycetota bacterium]